MGDDQGGAPNEVAFAVSDRGRGRPVLFQHGLCGDAGQPADVFPLDHYRCITVECRGHGQSEAGDPSQFGIATFAEDVARIVVGRGLSPLPVGGISMGAALALRLAITQPSSVSALILARPAWVVDAAPPSMAPNALVGSFLALHEPGKARRLFEATRVAAHLAEFAPDNLASLLSFFSRADPATTGQLLIRISADGPGITRAHVGAIRVPTLVIGHHRDLIHPFAMAEELADLIPAARLAVIPPKADGLDAYREGFRAALLGFLDEIYAER